MSTYCDKVKKYYGTAGSNSFPAPGSNGPAQSLYENHATYQNANHGPVVEGSDSWPGSANPTTQRMAD